MDFLKRQQVASVHELDVIRWHALGASKITAVGNGDPEIDDGSSHPVDKFR